MADNDYISENRKKPPNTTVLSHRLEDELAQLDSESDINISAAHTGGIKSNKSKSIHPTRAYELVFNKMNTDREKVKNTMLGTVFNNALTEAGIPNPEEIWKSL